MNHARGVLAYLVSLAMPMVATPSMAAFPEDTEGMKAVLVTGASSGIGRMTAETLAAEGHLVYAGARKQADLDELNAIDNVQAIRLDVTERPKSMRRWKRFAAKATDCGAW